MFRTPCICNIRKLQYHTLKKLATLRTINAYLGLLKLVGIPDGKVCALFVVVHALQLLTLSKRITSYS